MQKPATEFQKFAWLLIALVIDGYAIYGLMADDLVMPYKPWGSGRGTNGLIQQYSVAYGYFADTHPSIGNYFMLTTGQIITNNDGYKER